MTIKKHDDSVIDQFAEKTNQLIADQKATQKSLFESVRDAKLALSDCNESLRAYFEKVQCSRSTLNKMLKVIDCQFITDNYDKLSPAWTALYAIAVILEPENPDSKTPKPLTATYEQALDLLNTSPRVRKKDPYIPYIDARCSAAQIRQAFEAIQPKSNDPKDKFILARRVVKKQKKPVVFYMPKAVADEDRERVEKALDVLRECNFVIDTVDL